MHILVKAARQARVRDFEQMRYLLQWLGVGVARKGSRTDSLAQQIPIKCGAGPCVGPGEGVEEVLG